MKLLRLLRFPLCVFLIAVLLCTVSAHPGSTDSNGGHTDHSSGEYHYHHGYSAHSHYDMDGDGKKDCPYNFNDQTGKHSGSSSGSNSSSGNKNPPFSSETNRSTWDDLIAFFSTPYGIFCIIAVILQVIHAIIMVVKDLKPRTFGILIVINLIFFVVSFHTSFTILIACGLLYVLGVFVVFILFPVLAFCVSIIWNGIKYLFHYLFPKTQ